MHRFLDVFPWCLDRGLCVVPLRASATSIDDYAAGCLLHDFLLTLFERVVVTSTQVELIFGTLTKLLGSSSKQLGLASLGAKFTNSTFQKTRSALASREAGGEGTRNRRTSYAGRHGCSQVFRAHGQVISMSWLRKRFKTYPRL